jgi:hypothetical protein
MGGPYGASDRLRIDASCHLPGVPIWNGYPIELLGWRSGEVQNRTGTVVVVERVGSRAWGRSGLDRGAV